MSEVVVKGTMLHQYDAQQWCLFNLGVDSKDFNYGKWYISKYPNDLGPNYIITYVFKSEEDATLFALRWV